MAGRAAVFVDGGYLDYVARAAGVFGKIDFRRFFEVLSEPKELMRAYYYHCLPYQSANPTPEEAQRFGKTEAFFNSLDRVPRTEVRKGKLAFRGNRADGSPIFVQKQVDSLMATDLVMLSAKHLIDEAIIVTGDSDLLPAITIAKHEGVVIRLAHGIAQNFPHNDVWKTADERVPLNRQWFTQCQLPMLPPAGANGDGLLLPPYAAP